MCINSETGCIHTFSFCRLLLRRHSRRSKPERSQSAYLTLLLCSQEGTGPRPQRHISRGASIGRPKAQQASANESH